MKPVTFKLISHNLAAASASNAALEGVALSQFAKYSAPTPSKAGSVAANKLQYAPYSNNEQ